MVVIVRERDRRRRLAVYCGAGRKASWRSSQRNGVVRKMEDCKVRGNMFEPECVAGGRSNRGVTRLEPVQRDKREPSFWCGEALSALRAELRDLLQIVCAGGGLGRDGRQQS